MTKQGRFLGKALSAVISVPAAGIIALGVAVPANAACVNTIINGVTVCVPSSTGGVGGGGSGTVGNGSGNAPGAAVPVIGGNNGAPDLPPNAPALPVPVPVVKLPAPAAPVAPAVPAPGQAPIKVPPVVSVPQVPGVPVLGQPQNAVKAPAKKAAYGKTAAVPATADAPSVKPAPKAGASKVKAAPTASSVASATPSTTATAVAAPTEAPAATPSLAAPVAKADSNWFNIDGVLGFNPSDPAGFVLTLLGGSAVAAAATLYWARKAHRGSVAASE